MPEESLNTSQEPPPQEHRPGEDDAVREEERDDSFDVDDDFDDEEEPELEEDFDDEEEPETRAEHRGPPTPEAIVAFLHKSKEIYERWCCQVERDPRKDYFTDKEWRDYYTVWCQEMGKTPSEQEYNNPYPYDLMVGTKHATRAARENYHGWLQQADGHVVENTIWVKADPRYPGIDPYTIWRIETGNLLPLEAYEKWKLDTGKDSFREFLRETYLDEGNPLIASFHTYLNEQRKRDESAPDPLDAPLSDLVEPEDIAQSGINEPEAEPPSSSDQLNREASHDREPER
jgi:hypothetical protein